MAAATRLLAGSQGCTAVLNYDNLGLLATGVTVDNTKGVETIVFSIVINGQILSAATDVGQISTITFPITAVITIGVSIGERLPLQIGGYELHSIGSG